MLHLSGTKDIPLLDLGRFDAGESERRSFLAELRAAAHDVGQNYLKGRLRSHPDVARRHYASMVAATPLPAEP